MALFLSVFVIPASAYASTDFSVISPSKKFTLHFSFFNISSFFKDDHKKEKDKYNHKKKSVWNWWGHDKDRSYDNDWDDDEDWNNEDGHTSSSDIWKKYYCF